MAGEVMTRFNHTIIMTLLVIVICLVIGCATWQSFQKVGEIYQAESEHSPGIDSGKISILISLRQVLLLVLLVLVALGIVLVAEHLYIRENTKQLEIAVNSDMLTGACSRRYGSDCLVEAFREFRETGVSPAVVAFDLDHLKAINDSCGHIMGDTVLQGVVSVVYQNIGDADLIIRWGGDEFVALLHGVDSSTIGDVGEKLVEAVSSTEFQFGYKVISPSISLGASFFSPTDTSFADALSRADAALYQAKKLGKNRSCVAESDTI